MEKKLMMMVVATVAAAFGAWAETETVGGYIWTYSLNGDTAEIYGTYSDYPSYDFTPAISPKPTGAVTIPSTLGGKSVTSIGSYAFSGCSGLASVTMPDSVMWIEWGAFSGCSGLESVYVSVGDVDRVKALMTNSGFDVSCTRFIEAEAVARVALCEVDGAVNATSASEYNGYLYDERGAMRGTIQVKVGKPKAGLASVKVTVVVGAAKASLKAADNGKAAIAANGPTTMRLVGGESCEVTLGAEGLSGSYGSYLIDGARNFFSSKDKGEQGAANGLLAKWFGPVNVVWDGGTVSVSIGKKGKAKVAVTLADGTKATANAQLLVGEEWLCVPVVVTKKMNLAFTLWLPRNDGAALVEGLSGDVVVGKPGALKTGAKFGIDAEAFSARWGQRALPYLPDGMAVTQSGAKWALPKAGKVQKAKDGTIDSSKLGENPCGLKLTYKAKDGSFKGSFKVYAEVKGKPKATTVSVTGFLLNGIGCGTATIKKVGSLPIRVE